MFKKGTATNDIKNDSKNDSKNRGGVGIHNVSRSTVWPEMRPHLKPLSCGTEHRVLSLEGIREGNSGRQTAGAAVGRGAEVQLC